MILHLLYAIACLHIVSIIVFIGGCGPCTYMLEQPCQCGRVTKERLCTELDWTCGQVYMYMHSYILNIIVMYSFIIHVEYSFRLHVIAF